MCERATTQVLISLLGLLAAVVPLFGRLKALRILRVLRPLRLLQRNPGMKLIIDSLIKTLPSVVEVSAQRSMHTRTVPAHDLHPMTRTLPAPVHMHTHRCRPS